MQKCPLNCQRFSDISISERILNSLFLVTIAFFPWGNSISLIKGATAGPDYP